MLYFMLQRKYSSLLLNTSKTIENLVAIVESLKSVCLLRLRKWRLATLSTNVLHSILHYIYVLGMTLNCLVAYLRENSVGWMQKGIGL